MATLALSLAGQFVGGAVGGPIGATIGRALGALAGSAIDSTLFADRPQPAATVGADLRLQGSSEGAPIPKLYGWGRLSGNIIWATELERIEAESRGAKGFGGGDDGEDAEPTICANFALGLCEGEVARLGRVWADGQLLDLTGVNYRFYRGTETQAADSLIEAKQGANAPAYRGLCYLVFERLPLTPFGNRIPNITVELCRVVGELEPLVTAVTVIPGATEFGYDPAPRVRLLGPGATVPENAHQAAGVSDWTLSLDELTALCPNLEEVSLVVAWFGDDLRCGTCAVAPKVEAADRTIVGADWSVAGLGRGDVGVVSMHDGGPAYGGTPSDAAVLAAIADLKARGLRVTLYPLLLLDIPEGNALGQPAYPWRGRIAVQEGSEGTAAAASEVAAFSARYRDFVLHYAGLGAGAGIDGFIIGSELRGLSSTRALGNSFPFVDALVSLAADVRAVLPAAMLTYAADWSEYSGVQSGGEKLFHLDPLWASADIDAVGIDNYLPLADWRGDGGPDAAQWDGPYDLDYLRANVAGGEGFDWYYASDADRSAGTRTPITDGAYGEPWVWRSKDLVSWWSHAHHDRPGGVRNASATAWVPRSKPIWFTELGCGAVDKGANQPNLFSDPKSSESGKPYFSTGASDPLAQRQALRVVLAYWADDANNPVSDVYAGRMLARTTLWTWDARPYPAFPLRTDVWSDGPNHLTGHWLTGRLGGMASDELAAAIGADFGATAGSAEGRPPFVHGYVVEAPQAARAALEPLLAASGLALRDRPEGLELVAPVARDALTIADVVAEDGPMLSRRRPDPGEAVGQVALGYLDRERGYQSGSVTAIAASGGMLQTANAGMVLDLSGARATAERLLGERLAHAETVELALPPSQAGLEVGDAIAVDDAIFEVTEIRDGLARRLAATAVPPVVEMMSVAGRVGGVGDTPASAALPVLAYAHLPPAPDDVGHSRLAAAAYASPWPGRVTVTEESSAATIASLGAAATLGELTVGFGPGGIFTWDDTNALEVTLYAGHLASRDELEVLAGANHLAVETDAGDWEVVAFADAELVAPGQYRLTRLLRGRWGSDFAIGPAAAGNRVLLLDARSKLVPVQAAWLDATLQLRSYAGATDADGTVASVTIGLGPVVPLAPVHLASARDGSGDVALGWVRRSRADADSWAGDDAPLDVTPEAYRVTIYDGGTPVRSLDAGAPAATYSAADQAADFGALPASFGWSVAQLSPLYGPGHAATASFTT